MSSIGKTARLSARLASQHGCRHTARRGFRRSACEQSAHNFTMPALSPTMTEGNISSWRVKEGDSFTAGDVLLEIETDKATMDVEAQDDGILVKIMQAEGSKGVKVGQRIAVTADAGDDLSSLDIPAEDAAASPSQPDKSGSSAKEEEIIKTSTSSAEASTPSKPRGGVPEEHAQTQGGRVQKQTYPLYPSVEHLLHTNGLTEEDADKIPATGPNGRLLKGDVLAYLGRIAKDYPAQSSARLTKLSHLDLSNIQLAKPAPKPEPAKPVETTTEPELPRETEIAVPISLAAVVATQKRVQDSLGIFLPLSTFIARASELANEDLPPSKSRKPTADDLFNAVLGLSKVDESSRGHYIPQITGLSPMPSARPTKGAKKPDIIDLLATTKAAKKTSRAIPGAIGLSAGQNVFSVTAKPGEERRAATYLDRLKLALETEPGRLVL